MEEYAEKTNQISKYNEANLQIMRLNQNWLKAEFYANHGQLIKWKFILDTIWRELYADILRKKDDDLIKKNKKLKGLISKAKTKVDLYNALNDRHENLKEIQDAAGKGAIYYDADNEDMD